ncbi:MAG TPA: hypothetical protein VK125_04545 [Bacillota bacterium]|nr:hypothetical protein [Bacillota bacterium]
MHEWKQAYALARLELGEMKTYILYYIAIVIYFLFLMNTSFPGYFENSSFGLDILFVLLFAILPRYLRKRDFQWMPLQKGWYASYFGISLSTLPIKRRVIAKYHFLVHIILSVPIQLAVLTLIYITSSPLKEQISLSNYIVFAIIWLCINIYFGSSGIRSAAGSNIFMNIALFMIGTFIFFIVGTILFYKIFSGGIIGWTIYIANEYPFLSIICSIGLAILSVKFWLAVTVKRMRRYDYFK